MGEREKHKFVVVLTEAKTLCLTLSLSREEKCIIPLMREVLETP